MAERPLFDQLDEAVTAILEGHEAERLSIDQSLVELVDVARDLRGLPRDEFRQHLKDQLARSEKMSSPQMKKEPKPPALSVYMCFKNASAAIDFYKKAFRAEELMRLAEPSGKIGHAELKIGGTVLMMSDEYPDYGALSPQTIGGSPVRMHLSVEDVDTFVERAVAAGALITRAIEDQFYGDRSGQITDPFGYTWTIATHQKDVPVEEMQRQFDEFSKQRPEMQTGKREGFHTVTPYLTVRQPAELLQFIKDSFLATEVFQTTGSAGGMHAEARIGDSMLMIGGAAEVEEKLAAIHLYVPDVDETYERSLKAGGISLMAPANQPYGERSGAVQDPSGNRWYIATTDVPLKEIAEDLHTVTLYLHAVGAKRCVEFLKDAFAGEEVMRSESPDGVVRHAKVRIGDSIVELGEAQSQWQPMATAIYMYVEDVDTLYERALNAGCESLLPPTDQPYGDRNAWVKDPFNNVWYLATHLGT